MRFIASTGGPLQGLPAKALESIFDAHDSDYTVAHSNKVSGGRNED